jgi:hypothetical protein
MVTWTDDFERSDIGPDAPNGALYVQQPTGRWTISNGAAFADARNADVFLLTDLGQGDIEVSMIHRNSTHYPQGVAVRVASGSPNYVCASVAFDDVAISARWTLESVIAGVGRVSWGHYTRKGYIPGRTTKLVVDDHKYYVYIDDVLRIHYTDVAEQHADTETYHGLFFGQQSDGGADSLTWSTDITPPAPGPNLLPGHEDAPVGCAELPVGDRSTHLVGLATEYGEGLADEDNALLVEEVQDG